MIDATEGMTLVYSISCDINSTPRWPKESIAISRESNSQRG